MLIHEMNKDECLLVLSGTRLARLGCAHNNQPYVVPVSLAYDDTETDHPCLYGVTTLGQKVEWMRENPLVCVEVDKITTHDVWVSVIAFGRYQELPVNRDRDEARLRDQVRTRQAGEAATPEVVNGDQNENEVGDDEGEHAWQVLKSNPDWWERGWAAWVARPHNDPSEPYRIIYFKISIDRVTGRKSTQSTRD